MFAFLLLWHSAPLVESPPNVEEWPLANPRGGSPSHRPDRRGGARCLNPE